jgi:hypothetical protein
VIMPERLIRFATRLGFELLVVFVGVTLAFIAENRREEGDRRAPAQEIYAALAAELSDHTELPARLPHPRRFQRIRPAGVGRAIYLGA